MSKFNFDPKKAVSPKNKRPATSRELERSVTPPPEPETAKSTKSKKSAPKKEKLPERPVTPKQLEPPKETMKVNPVDAIINKALSSKVANKRQKKEKAKKETVHDKEMKMYEDYMNDKK